MSCKMLAALGVAVATIGVTACSSTKQVDGPTIATTKTVTATVTASPTALAPPSPLRLGAAFKLPGLLVARVLNFQSNGVGQSNNADERYADLEVRVCAIKKTTVSNAPWTLVGVTDDNLDTVVTGGGLHEPQYPGVADPLNAGECVQGWITFVVPRTLKVKAAKYAPSNAKGEPLPHAIWDVSAK